MVPYPRETGRRHLALTPSLLCTWNTNYPPVQIHVSIFCMCSAGRKIRRGTERRNWCCFVFHSIFRFQSQWLQFLSDESARASGIQERIHWRCSKCVISVQVPSGHQNNRYHSGEQMGGSLVSVIQEGKSTPRLRQHLTGSATSVNLHSEDSS